LLIGGVPLLMEGDLKMMPPGLFNKSSRIVFDKDFAAHVAHGYITSSAETRKERVFQTIKVRFSNNKG